MRFMLAASAMLASTAAAQEFTPLHAAAWKGQENVVHVLLDGGADLDAKDNNGFTPLHLAVQRRLQGTEELTPVWRAADAEHFARWQSKVFRDEGQELVWLNAGAEREAVVRLLLDRGANAEAKDSDGDTPLHLAVKEGQENIVFVLLDGGTNTEAKNSDGDTPLHLAVREGQEAVARLLLNARADPNASNNDGDTPLHLAVRKGHQAVVRTLLAAGADPNAKTQRGVTPLHRAVIGAHEAVARLLLNAGADPNASSNDGFTPLHWVAGTASLPSFIQIGDAEGAAVVRLLLANGADPELRDNDGFTPLHRAAEAGKEAVVSALLDATAVR